ncbi:protein sidekick-2 isoform X2 [Syngnathus scovelli]|uniref:protein sidekick-2 isoform X2 n=1 Tax=Syngnathus scovelli TaxID=161590 RepID=UPI002110CEEE|nr:protein sidekick-2 isoform X2 [Syngnathus scovelli]
MMDYPCDFTIYIYMTSFCVTTMIGTVLGRMCELLRHCHLLLLLTGVFLDPCVVCSLGQIQPESCGNYDISIYEPCRLALPGGVAGLECYGKTHIPGLLTCQWRRGAAEEREANVTLIIRQKKGKFCKMYKIKDDEMKDTLSNIQVFERNLTVEVLEQVGSECSKDVFTAPYSSLLRCGPPQHVTFRRHSDGHVDVSAQWSQDDAKVVTSFCVRHKEVTDHQDDGNWRQVCCQGAAGCHLAGVKGSPVLEVQVACQISNKCSQCPWSHVYMLPPELTRPPLNLHVVENKMADKGGQRMISLTWMFAEEHDGFNVSLAKVSGEPPLEVLSVTRPPITLLLSNSAFHVYVNAFNNVSVSPSASITLMPPHGDDNGRDGGRLSVRVHNQMSFSVLWKDDLVRKYKCFCLEWSATYGPYPPNVSYKSFHEEGNNFWTVVDISEQLQAYTSYDVWLHVRGQQQTCNLKRVNNSQEVTYAKTRFYYLEGSPASAPSNLSVVSVTSSSLELRWSAISPEDRRGFLLGYVIHYAEDWQPERNISVGPLVHKYTLKGLRNRAAYRVQVSGFTRAGQGVRSAARMVETQHGISSNLTALVIISTLVVVTALLGSQFLRRAKVVFWPNIPNPEKSKSMQKFNAPTHLLLQPIDSLELEEECIATNLLVVELRAPTSSHGLSTAVDDQSAANSHDPPPLAACFSGYTSLDVIQQLMMMGGEGTLTR